MTREHDFDLVLCYGHERTLLATRLMLLESANVKVSPATHKAEYREMLRALLPQVVVLCHSLSREECLCAAEYASRVSPHSKILTMVNGTGRSHLDLECTYFTREGPGALCIAVMDLISASRFGESQARLDGSAEAAPFHA
jgi:hypothetical protein